MQGKSSKKTSKGERKEGQANKAQELKKEKDLSWPYQSFVTGKALTEK
jgi:hypothetical protein